MELRDGGFLLSQERQLSLPMTVDAKSLDHSLVDGMIQQAKVTFRTIFQYLVPLAFTIGEAMSVFKRRGQAAVGAIDLVNPNIHAKSESLNYWALRLNLT